MTKIHACFENTETGERWDFGDASYWPTREEAEKDLSEQGLYVPSNVRVIYTEIEA